MTRHLIEELVFEIATGSGNGAMQDEAWLRRLLTDHLLPVLDEVFDAVGEGDAVLVLPVLEIDLGEIGAAGFEQAVASRLRAALEDALQRALAEAREPRRHAGDNGDGRAAALVGPAESELAQLERFLVSGAMPWHADTAQAGLHEALLGRLLAGEADTLWPALARALAAAGGARRLAEQFPEVQLLAVLRGVAGGHAARFETLLAAWRQAHTGAKPEAAAWARVLAAAASVCSGADAEAACMDLRAALGLAGAHLPAPHPAQSDTGASVQRAAPPGAGLARAFLHFLENGVLPEAQDGTGQPAHQALLARLLEQGGHGVRTMLARALAAPGSARRLAEQFPRHQLLALLRVVAGDHAADFEALVAQLEVASAPARLAGEAWIQVLQAACGARSGRDAQAACARILAAPVPDKEPGAGAIVNTQGSTLGLLEQFLLGGPIPSDPGGAAVPAHRVLLDRLLAQGGPAVREALLRAARHPAGARRLAEHFSQAQLLAVACLVSGAGAAQVGATLAQARLAAGVDDTQVWQRVLRACSAGTAPVRDEGTNGPDSDALLVFLEGGSLREATGDPGTLAHVDLLARLLEGDGPWEVLAGVLARRPAARRFAQQFPEHQLRAVLRRLAGPHAARFEALLDEALAWPPGPGGSSHVAIGADVLAACAALATDAGYDADGACARIRAEHGGMLPVDAAPQAAAPAYRRRPGRALPAGAPGAAGPRWVPATPAPRHDPPAPAETRQQSMGAWPRRPQALLRLMSDYLSGAALPSGLPTATGATVHEALLARLLEGGNSGVWLALGRVLADPSCARRLRQDFPAHQVSAVLRRLEPAHAAALQALAGDEPGGKAAPERPLPPAGAHEPAAGSALQRLRQFLEHGLLPGADAIRPGTHEALLEALADSADAGLWRLLAQALERDDSAERLLTQFPQRQLLGLARMSAPGYAPALERLLWRVEDMQATRPGAWQGRLAAECLRQVLAACVARPPSAVLPGQIVARAVLALDSVGPASGTYVRRMGTAPAVGVRWRMDGSERRAVAALLRLAGMLEGLRAGIDAREGTGSALAPQAGDAPGVAVLTLRERARMARRLERLSRPLDRPPPGPAMLPAAGQDAPAALRGAIAARLDMNGEIGPGRRALMLEAIDARLDEVADAGPFLRRVLAALDAGASLDLDALAAADDAASTAVPAQGAALAPAQVLFAALQSGDIATARAHWNALLASHAGALRSGLRHYARNPALRQALARALPDAVFLDLVALFDAGGAQLLRTLLTPAPRLQALVGHGAAWDAWTLRCRVHALALLAGAEGRIESDAFLRAIGAGEGGEVPGLAAMLTSMPPAQAAPAPAQPAHVPASVSGRDSGHAMPKVDVFEDSGELLAIGNAGMVLAAPYLPRLFGALGLLTGGAFIDEAAAGRAVHLLQYMVTGQSHTPEYQLVLNKILCGLPTATPVPAGIDITSAEHDFIESMVGAMVVHAKVFGSSSVAAMRQTFFARKADLQLADDAWQLRVRPGPFDVLLDRLPWSYALVKFGWMTRPVHVTWRPA